MTASRRTSACQLLLWLLAISPLFAAELRADHWTSPPDERSQYEAPATRTIWKLAPLDKYNLAVAAGYNAVCVADADGLKVLDRLPETTEHVSFRVPVRLKDVKLLKRLPKLVSLEVSRTEPEVLRALVDLSSLKSLDTSGFLTESVAIELCRFKGLTAFSFLGEADAASIATLASKSHITALSLNLYNWDDDIVKALSSWDKLESLSLEDGGPPIQLPGDPPLPFKGRDSDVSSSAWDSLAKLKNLTEYRDNNPPALTGAAVAKIVAGKRIKLFTSGTCLTCDDFKAIGSSTSLTGLSVVLAASCQNEPLDVAEVLGSATKLAFLRVINFPRTWTGMNLLPTITDAEFAFVNTSEAELSEKLAGLPPNVTTLRLEDRLAPEALNALARWSGAKSCTALTLSARVGDARDFRQILGALTKFAELRDLSLDIRSPGILGNASQGVSRIAGSDWQGLTELQHLTSLRIGVGEPGKLGEDRNVKRASQDYYSFDREAARTILSHAKLRSLDLRFQVFQPGALEDIRASHLDALVLDGARDLGEADIDAISDSRIGTISLYGVRTGVSATQASKLVNAETRKLVSLEGASWDSNAAVGEVLLARKTPCIVYAD